MNFQVSELARVLVLIWGCGSYAVRKRGELEQTLPGLLKPVGLLGLAAVLMLVEPDFGATTVLFTTGWPCCSWPARACASCFGVGAAAALGVLVLITPYRMRRLTGFLIPGTIPTTPAFS